MLVNWDEAMESIPTESSIKLLQASPVNYHFRKYLFNFKTAIPLLVICLSWLNVSYAMLNAEVKLWCLIFKNET